jgi:hypothetical protein
MNIIHHFKALLNTWSEENKIEFYNYIEQLDSSKIKFNNQRYEFEDNFLDYRYMDYHLGTLLKFNNEYYYLNDNSDEISIIDYFYKNVMVIENKKELLESFYKAIKLNKVYDLNSYYCIDLFLYYDDKYYGTIIYDKKIIILVNNEENEKIIDMLEVKIKQQEIENIQNNINEIKSKYNV